MSKTGKIFKDKKELISYSKFIGLLTVSIFLNVTLELHCFVEDLGEKEIYGFPFKMKWTPIAWSAGNNIIIPAAIANYLIYFLIIGLTLFPLKKIIIILWQYKFIFLLLYTVAVILVYRATLDPQNKYIFQDRVLRDYQPKLISKNIHFGYY
jgi:hypothetical protein